MRKFLVTGGAGFIGSHITEFLLGQGHFVRVLDDFSSGTRAKISFLNNYSSRRYQVIKGDIRSERTCQKALKDIDYVIHQAARKTVPKSIKDPQLFNDVNINGTLNLLKASVDAKAKRFVFASSSSVYGDSKNFPQSEQDAPHPISPYAITKLTGEHYCAVYSHLYGLETVCLRYFNVFGPRQDFNDIYSAVIVKFIHLARKNKPLPVYGDGKQSRDFSFIENVVKANYVAATKPGLKLKHYVLNAGMGGSRSILDVIQTLEKIMGQEIAPQFLPVRAGDILRSEPDVRRIRQVLGFKPTVSFEAGLRKTIEASL